MNKKKWIQPLPAIGVYFIIYLIITILHSELWGDILSPVGVILSFGIILNTYFKSDRTQNIQKIWIVLSLACLSWAVADFLWAVYDLILRQNPENSDLISSFYMGTNIFLLAAVFIYAVYKIRKWNAIQLVVDTIAVSVSGLFLLWILFFDKSIEMLDLISKSGWITIISVAIDLAAFVGIAVWCFSIRGGKFPAYLQIAMSAILLYIVTDLYWFYLNLKHLYFPNSVIDAVYMASLLSIAVAAILYHVNNSATETVEGGYSNVGIRNRCIFILIGPVLTIIFKGFVLTDLLIFLFITLTYESLTIYIQAYIKNELLLKIEQNLNLELESRITERTKELVEKNKQLDFLSNQDTVTNLYNRRYFIRALETRLAKVAPGETLALLFIDLDRFKTINDTYGHFVGDQVLVEVSKHLQALNRPNDLLARLGGDEFVLAVHADYGYREIENIAMQIIESCSKTIEIENYSFCLTISVGISIYPLDAQSSDMLMKNADIAMYQAKKLGYNKYVAFNEQLSNAIQRKNEIEILLKKVNFDKEFKLFYQPQFSIPDKKLIGMEALLRWSSPQKGFIPPDEFIPIAEETDHIIPIGDWAMQNAICQIDRWNHTYGLALKIGINVSPKQLDQSGFIWELQSAMADHNVNPEWVDIEITEGVAMGGGYRMSEISCQFKNVGVSISIDDFGTGYSSLSYLKLFPFDRIKIAKPLIDAITTDDYDRNITKFTILLAKSIGIKTIAEGVESQEQLDLLTDLGCEQIQGYFLGRPLPPLEFEERFLKKI